MTIYKYILKNGNFIHSKNIKCKKFSYDNEISIAGGSYYMWSYCNINALNGKCFLLSLFELNENQLIKSTLDVKKNLKNMFDD